MPSFFIFSIRARRLLSPSSVTAVQPSNTRVNSPFGRSKYTSASLTVPRKISSYTLVISRQTAIRRSPSTCIISLSARISLCGASYITNVAGWVDISTRRFCLSACFRGKKPINKKLSVGRPLAATALVTADAPGIGTTRKPFSVAATTSSYPGSEIPGIPASETTATSPVSNCFKMKSILPAPLCS